MTRAQNFIKFLEHQALNTTTTLHILHQLAGPSKSKLSFYNYRSFNVSGVFILQDYLSNGFATYAENPELAHRLNIEVSMFFNSSFNYDENTIDSYSSEAARQLEQKN